MTFSFFKCHHSFFSIFIFKNHLINSVLTPVDNSSSKELEASLDIASIFSLVSVIFLATFKASSITLSAETTLLIRPADLAS